VTTKLLDIAMIPAGTCGSSFAAQIRSSHDSYKDIIRDAHISAE
jgi:hypothetical protein